MRHSHTTLRPLLGPSVFVQRHRDIVRAIIGDHGGAGQSSETRKQLIRRFASTAVLAEQMEKQLARGEKMNVTEYALVCGTMVRIAQIIGIDRRMRDRDRIPTLSDYLRSEEVE